MHSSSLFLCRGNPPPTTTTTTTTTSRAFVSSVIPPFYYFSSPPMCARAFTHAHLLHTLAHISHARNRARLKNPNQNCCESHCHRGNSGWVHTQRSLSYLGFCPPPPSLPPSPPPLLHHIRILTTSSYDPAFCMQMFNFLMVLIL